MKNELSEISVQHAKEICALIKKPFISIAMGKGFGTQIDNMDVRWGVSEKTSVIQLTEQPGYAKGEIFCHTLHIEPTGQIQLFGQYHRPSRNYLPVLFPINTLPISDYLRKQGFEFVY